MAGDTIAHAGLGLCLAGLIAPGLLCYSFYYLASRRCWDADRISTVRSWQFHIRYARRVHDARVLMGFLQIGWFAVATYVQSIYPQGMGTRCDAQEAPFIVIGLVWGLAMALVGAKGIQYVG